VKTIASGLPSAAKEPISRTMRQTNNSIAFFAMGPGDARRIRMSEEIPDTPK
jgi:hypothetical protein